MIGNKIIFWTGIVLFVIPEAIWSPLVNFYASMFISSESDYYVFRDNFIFNNVAGWRILLVLELMGILMAIKVALGISNKKVRLFASILFGVLIIILLGAIWETFTFHPDTIL